MASRINTRFLLLLITIAGGLAIAVGAIAFFAYRDDPTRNLRRAEASIAEGDLDGAVVEYARAVGKRPNDLEILALYEQTILQIRPVSQERAEELYANWLSALRQRGQILSAEPQGQLGFLREIYKNARLTGPGGWWQQLSDFAQDAMDRCNPASDGYSELEFLQMAGEASQVKLEGEDAVARLEAKFEDFIVRHPDHGVAAAAYAILLLGEGHSAYLERNTAEAQARFDKAQAVIRAAQDAAPNDPEIALAQGRLLIARRFHGGQIEPAEIDSVANRIVDLVSRGDDRVHLNEAVSLLPILGGAEGTEQAIRLLRSFLDRDPAGVLERFGLARLLHETGQEGAALREVQVMLDSEPLPVSFFATYRYELQLRAAQILFFIEHGRTARMRGAELEAQTARAMAARHRLAELAPGGESNVYVVECDAWLALSSGNFAVAVSKFHEVVERSPAPDARKLWGYARALDSTGSTGRALDMLLQAMQTITANDSFLYEVARLESKLGRFADAEAHLVEALAINEANAQAVELLAQVRAAAGTPSGAEDDITGVLAAAQELMDSNDLAGARAILLQGLEQHPDNGPLLVALIQVEARGEWREQALTRVDELIAIYPESADLKALRESVRGGDAIAVVRISVEATYTEPVDIEAFMYISLRRLADEQIARGNDLDAAGQSEQADEARRLAERADAEAEVHLREALALEANQPQFIDRQFIDALERDDAAEARRLANLARETNADQARGLTYDARIELRAGDFAKAVVTLVDASKAKPYDGWIWRTLAITYLELGNVVDAQSAFNSAIAQNPNDPITIRMFARTLADSGNSTQALGVLRDAVERQLRDPQLIEQWLTLEAERGDIARAIRERRARFAEAPANRINALRLATLLGIHTPTRESILNEDNEPVYTERQWSVMGVAARDQAIAAARQQWINEADGMFEELSALPDADLNLAAARAMHYRNTGRAQEGRQFLETFVRAELARQPGAVPYVIMAQYLFTINARADAEQWLNDGLPLQDPQQREIERALASLYLSMNNPQRALDYLLSALRGSEDRDLRLLTAEVLISLGRLEDAESEIAKVGAPGAAGFQVELLRARVAAARGETLFAEQRTAEADRAFMDELAAIERAIQMRSVDPRPYVMKAASLFNQYRRTGGSRPSLLHDASTLLDRALQLSAGFAPALQMRADLLLARTPPDVNGAVRELAALLNANRWDEATRRRLIELHVATNDLDRAIALARAGDTLEPHRPEWAVLLGQLLERKSDHAGAAEAYRQAYVRSREPSVLQYWAVALLRTAEPAAVADVVSTLGANTAGFAQFPALQCIYAQALAMSNRFEEAREQLRAAHEPFKRQVDSKERPTALSDWMRMTAEIFRGRASVAELESFVNDVTGGRLNRGEAFWLGREYTMSGPDGRARALALYRIALDDAIATGDMPDQAELHYHIGETEHALGDYPAAAEHYDKVLEINPNHVLALNNLAYMHLTRIPAPDKALPLAERAIGLVPNNPNVLDTYGVALLRAGRAREALDPLQRSVDLAPQAENHLHLAEVMVALDRHAEALAHLDQAMQLNPSPDLLVEINELRRRVGE